MASPALDEAIAARFAPPFHAWYDVTHDGPLGREHKGRVEKQARYGLGAIAAHAAGGPRLAGAWGSLEACSSAETGLRSASWPKPEPPLLPAQALRGALPARPLSGVRVQGRGRGARAARAAHQRGTQPPTLNPQPPTLNPQPWPKPSTLTLKTLTLNP